MLGSDITAVATRAEAEVARERQARLLVGPSKRVRPPVMRKAAEEEEANGDGGGEGGTEKMDGKRACGLLPIQGTMSSFLRREGE